MAEQKPSVYQDAKAQYGNMTGVDQQSLDDTVGGLQYYFREYINTEVPEAEGARVRYQEGVREMIDAAPPAVRDYIQATNEGRMLDFLNNQQFYNEDVLPSDAAAREAVIYSGKVPYGFAERNALGSRGRSNLQGMYFDTAGRSYGKSPEDVPPEIFFGGNRVGTNTTIHEGYHKASEPNRVNEEKAIRSMDYFRAKLGNDEKAENDARMYLLREGLDVREPRDLGEARMAALRVAMGIKPEFYQALPEEAKDRFRQALEGRMETGLIASLIGGDPEFDTEGFTFSELGEMPEEQFFEMLKDAPAFTEDGGGMYDYLRYEGPRMIGEGDSAVRAYQDGGVISLKDRAVNMNRGPRSNGIMQYVPYITGATNGY